MGRRGGPGEQKRPAQVGVDHLVPLLVLHARNQRVAGDAGIVHQDIEPLPFAEHLLDDFVHAVADWLTSHSNHAPCRRRAEISATVSASFCWLRATQATRAPARPGPRQWPGQSRARHRSPAPFGPCKVDTPFAVALDRLILGWFSPCGYLACAPLSFAPDLLHQLITPWHETWRSIRLSSPRSTRPGPTS